MARALRIGLLWHGDASGNLGVGALTVGHMALIAEAARRAGMAVDLVMLRPGERGRSYVTDGIAERHDITARFMALPAGYWAVLGTLDAVLDIGAGDSFADIYPDKRFAYIVATKLMALARGVPLVLSPQTIGPFSRQPHRRLAAYVLSRARAVFARDRLSLEAALALAPDARTHGAIDVAFALPFEAAPRGPGVRAGINVSGLLWSGGYGGANDYGLAYDYRAFVVGLARGLLARGAAVELVAHVVSDLPKDDDASAIAEVARLVPEARVVPRFASPSAAKSHISGVDFMVAARMHAAIAAFSAGVAVLPVSYSRKFEGLFGALSYPHVLGRDTPGAEAAIAIALDAFEQRAALGQALARGRDVIADGLEAYTAWLAAFFEELSR